MKNVDIRMQKFALSIITALLMLIISSAWYSAEVILTPPQGGATVSGNTTVSMNTETNVSWANLFIDRSYFASTPYTSGISPITYGQYSGSGDGYGLIGGPLLSDWQAASYVRATQKSRVEENALGTGSANANANNYYSYIAAHAPGNYLNQLSSFHGAYSGSSWKAEADRIDGACPMANPTTAEVLQWAANKWGINPLLLYAVVTNESHWDQTGVGDYGRSSGLTQVADRNSSGAPNHAYPGFSGAGSMLARESSCFNADFYAGRLYAAYHGQTGYGAGNITQAIHSWDPNSSVYITNTYNALSNHTWISQAFYGSFVPY